MDCGKNGVQFYCHKIQVASIYEGSKLFLPHLFAQCNYQTPFQVYHFLHKTYCGFDCQSLFHDIVDLLLDNVFLENIDLCFCFVLEIIELDNCFCRDDYHWNFFVDKIGCSFPFDCNFGFFDCGFDIALLMHCFDTPLLDAFRTIRVLFISEFIFIFFGILAWLKDCFIFLSIKLILFWGTFCIKIQVFLLLQLGRYLLLKIFLTYFIHSDCNQLTVRNLWHFW